LKLIEFDVITKTAGDYTAEFKISEAAFNRFKDNIFDSSAE